MRIVSWNCCGSAKGEVKQKFISSLNPDVLILQESRKSDFSNCEYRLWETNKKDKDNPKGLGVYILNSSISLEKYPSSIDFEIVQPLKLKQNNISLDLIVVWAYNGRSVGKYKGKRGMMIDAVSHYSNFLKPNALWIGDFNNGPTIRDGKFWSPLKKIFLDGGMNEVIFLGSPMTHRNNKGTEHHIDHCFVGNDLAQSLCSSERIPLEAVPSDHIPLVLDLNLDN